LLTPRVRFAVVAQTAPRNDISRLQEKHTALKIVFCHHPPSNRLLPTNDAARSFFDFGHSLMVHPEEQIEAG
jgi:hypothetical protein